jgi:hypothetical protein
VRVVGERAGVDVPIRGCRKGQSSLEVFEVEVAGTLIEKFLADAIAEDACRRLIESVLLTEADNSVRDISTLPFNTYAIKRKVLAVNIS